MSTFIDLKLYCTSPFGDPGECEILIKCPEKFRDDFVCDAEISGFEEVEVFPSRGVDPIQAAILSLQWVSTTIQGYEKKGWQFFLTSNRSMNLKYSSNVWTACFRLK